MRLPPYIVIGRHQILALALLCVFALQCGWLVQRRPFTSDEQDHIWSGRQQLEYGSMPKKFRHTPLVNIASAAPLKLDAGRAPVSAVNPESVQREVQRLHWMLRAPFLLAGILLGVSIWYVARRLYGNPGGYIALTLYCFSPVMILQTATIGEAVPAAWGIFGVIFTSIAISHNLYAPWRKWRYRTVLLSVAMALAVASHPAAMIVVPLAFVFIMYLAPGKRWSGVFVFFIAMIMAMVMVYASYGFLPRALMNGIDLREWLAYQPAQAREVLLGDTAAFMRRFNPALIALLLTSVGTYFIWRRSRYFGNTSPVMVAVGLMYLALVTPLALSASLWALPFIYVFIGGIWADLLETRRWMWVLGALLILLGENAWYCYQTLKTLA